LRTGYIHQKTNFILSGDGLAAFGSLSAFSKKGRHLCTALLIACLGACTIDSTATSPAANQQTSHVQNAQAPIELDNPLAPGWQVVHPQGETLCSDGSPYRFFTRPGDAQKLLVYLQGGGGCWNRETCDPNINPTYTQNIPEDFAPWPFGIFNLDHPDNPFAEHTIVMAPYCTGDVHLGARDAVYETPGLPPLTIHHRGRTNMQAVLDWTYANVKQPETIFVTGSSAGAIPSPFYTALIANQYPDAQIAQLGDGAGGYRSDPASRTTQPNVTWGINDYIGEEPGFDMVDMDALNYEQLYIAAAKAHPQIVFAEYDTAEDNVQKLFLSRIEGKDSRTLSLFDGLIANYQDIRDQVPNFRGFIAGGNSHTVLGRPEFYRFGANGHSVRDWVADLESFKTVQDVSCTQCDHDTFAGEPLTAGMQQLWRTWDDPQKQYVEPFKIFDNLYYVGIDWVAAYVLVTDEGLVLFDSLYGKYVRLLESNIRKVGLDPADIKYVINTHGHFDHAGGSAYFQAAHGATVVMAEEDWRLAEAPAESAHLYAPAPKRASGRHLVAEDGDVIEIGGNRIELFKTPGHTEGVLSMRYTVQDGNASHRAITLGGVGLNFTGVERTESYIKSYQRLQDLQRGVAVSLPNHAAMGTVFELAKQLQDRGPNEPHPFVDEQRFADTLSVLITNAQEKLEAEKSGTAEDPLEALSRAINAD